VQIIERGPVSPIRDIARAAVAGAVVAVPFGVLLAALEFPYWGETLASFALVFSFFLPLGLVFRLLSHGLHRHVNRGFDERQPVWPLLAYSRPVFAFGAFWLAFHAVLAVASGLSTGDWSP
jgi:hypothetical protein